ncbi:unnamed protein product [Rhodiola kirilowii]
MVGEMTYFLGLQQKQKSNGIVISPSKYARKLIKKFELEKVTRKKTHAVTHVKITKDEAGTSVDQTLYKSMIGSLLYLTARRPHIVYDDGVSARYKENPKESHLVNVKRIIKYVCGIDNYRLWYTNDTSSCLVCYCDADWVGKVEDRKSTSRGFSFWATTWSLGSARSRTTSLYLLLRKYT